MRDITYTTRNSKLAFTLVELLIVVAILGIMAAVVVPAIKSYTTEAKESAAKRDLSILRSAIELYASQHNAFPPGYVDGLFKPLPPITTAQFCSPSDSSGEVAEEPDESHNLGPYLLSIPKNPFNDKDTIQILAPATPFPESPTDATGWIYKPAAKAIRLNSPGTDAKGVDYYDY
jgi:prepilin-type N-terminal cleavage/methylation domain-containing protein